MKKYFPALAAALLISFFALGDTSPGVQRVKVEAPLQNIGSVLVPDIILDGGTFLTSIDGGYVDLVSNQSNIGGNKGFLQNVGVDGGLIVEGNAYASGFTNVVDPTTGMFFNSGTQEAGLYTGGHKEFYIDGFGGAYSLGFLKVTGPLINYADTTIYGDAGIAGSLSVGKDISLPTNNNINWGAQSLTANGTKFIFSSRTTTPEYYESTSVGDGFFCSVCQIEVDRANLAHDIVVGGDAGIAGNEFIGGSLQVFGPGLYQRTDSFNQFSVGLAGQAYFNVDNLGNSSTYLDTSANTAHITGNINAGGALVSTNSNSVALLCTGVNCDSQITGVYYGRNLQVTSDAGIGGNLTLNGNMKVLDGFNISSPDTSTVTIGGGAYAGASVGATGRLHAGLGYLIGGANPGAFQSQLTTTGFIATSGGAAADLIQYQDLPIQIMSSANGPSEVQVKLGTMTADGLLTGSNKLLSIRTGITGTEVEKAYVRADGTINTIGQYGGQTEVLTGVVPGSGTLTLNEGLMSTLTTSLGWYAPNGATWGSAGQSTSNLAAIYPATPQIGFDSTQGSWVLHEASTPFSPICTVANGLCTAPDGGLFVDLVNNQSNIGGNKTWTGDAGFAGNVSIGGSLTLPYATSNQLYFGSQYIINNGSFFTVSETLKNPTDFQSTTGLGSDGFDCVSCIADFHDLHITQDAGFDSDIYAAGDISGRNLVATNGRLISRNANGGISIGTAGTGYLDVPVGSNNFNFNGAAIGLSGSSITTDGYYQATAAYPSGTAFYAVHGGAFQTGDNTWNGLSGVLNSSSNIAFRLNSVNTLSASDTQLLSIQNGGTEVASITRDSTYGDYLFTIPTPVSTVPSMKLGTKFLSTYGGTFQFGSTPAGTDANLAAAQLSTGGGNTIYSTGSSAGATYPYYIEQSGAYAGGASNGIPIFTDGAAGGALGRGVMLGVQASDPDPAYPLFSVGTNLSTASGYAEAVVATHPRFLLQVEGNGDVQFAGSDAGSYDGGAPYRRFPALIWPDDVAVGPNPTIQPVRTDLYNYFSFNGTLSVSTYGGGSEPFVATPGQFLNSAGLYGISVGGADVSQEIADEVAIYTNVSGFTDGGPPPLHNVVVGSTSVEVDAGQYLFSVETGVRSANVQERFVVRGNGDVWLAGNDAGVIANSGSYRNFPKIAWQDDLVIDANPYIQGARHADLLPDGGCCQGYNYILTSAIDVQPASSPFFINTGTAYWANTGLYSTSTAGSDIVAGIDDELALYTGVDGQQLFLPDGGPSGFPTIYNVVVGSSATGAIDAGQRLFSVQAGVRSTNPQDLFWVTGDTTIHNRGTDGGLGGLRNLGGGIVWDDDYAAAYPGNFTAPSIIPSRVVNVLSDGGLYGWDDVTIHGNTLITGVGGGVPLLEVGNSAIFTIGYSGFLAQGADLWQSNTSDEVAIYTYGSGKQNFFPDGGPEGTYETATGVIAGTSATDPDAGFDIFSVASGIRSSPSKDFIIKGNGDQYWGKPNNSTGVRIYNQSNDVDGVPGFVFTDTRGGGVNQDTFIINGNGSTGDDQTLRVQEGGADLFTIQNDGLSIFQVGPLEVAGGNVATTNNGLLGGEMHTYQPNGVTLGAYFTQMPLLHSIASGASVAVTWTPVVAGTVGGTMTISIKDDTASVTLSSLSGISCTSTAVSTHTATGTAGAASGHILKLYVDTSGCSGTGPGGNLIANW